MPTISSLTLDCIRKGIVEMTRAHKHNTKSDAATYQELLAELTKPFAALQTLRERAIEALTPTVQELVHGCSGDVQRIEQTLDQLLDQSCLPDGLALFQALCRHYWTLDPQAAASYVNAYREMWDEEVEAQNELGRDGTNP